MDIDVLLDDINQMNDDALLNALDDVSEDADEEELLNVQESFCNESFHSYFEENNQGNSILNLLLKDEKVRERLLQVVDGEFLINEVFADCNLTKEQKSLFLD